MGWPNRNDERKDSTIDICLYVYMFQNCYRTKVVVRVQLQGYTIRISMPIRKAKIKYII